MKKTLIFLIVISVTGCIKAQFLPSIDSLVIKLGIVNETENWCYTFSFSEQSVLVRGTDYLSGCFVLDEEVSNYTEEIKRRYILHNSEIVSPQTADNYTYNVLNLTSSIISQSCQEEILGRESTYDTVWHFSLYKDGDNIGYFFFDINKSCIRNQQFVDLLSILRQIKKKRCPIATR